MGNKKKELKVFFTELQLRKSTDAGCNSVRVSDLLPQWCPPHRLLMGCSGGGVGWWALAEEGLNRYIKVCWGASSCHLG